MRILPAPDCPDLMSMADGIELSKLAFSILANPGQSTTPKRHILELPSGRFTVMTGATKNGLEAGAKVLTVFPGNRAKGLARINALVVIMNTETGLVDAIIDGTWLTAFRTGAACGASVDLLARLNASVLTVFGAGPVAYMSVLAAASAREIGTIRICNRERTRGERLARQLSKEPGIASAARVCWQADPARAVAGADIVITATNATSSVFPDAALSTGTHISAMGGGYPNYELEPETMYRAAVFVDSRTKAAEECGDIRHAWGEIPADELPITGEIGDIVTGYLPGRKQGKEITIFESSGSAIQDVIVGSELARRAQQSDTGTEIEPFHAGEFLASSGRVWVTKP